MSHSDKTPEPTSASSQVSRGSQRWPISRMVAFSAMNLTVAVFIMFTVTAVIVNVYQPDLGNESLIVPLMGAVLFAGTSIAALGLGAGIVDLISSHDRRGVTVLSVFINGAVCLFMFTVVLIGLMRSM